MEQIYITEEDDRGEILSTLNRPTEIEALSCVCKYEKIKNYKLTNLELLVYKYERELLINYSIEPDNCIAKLCDKFGENKKTMKKILKDISYKLEYQEHIGIFLV